jgi:hypothetical protein
VKAKILDTKVEGDAQCYLVKASIASYVKDLSEDFFDFHIQREQTSNIYLDSLSDTILSHGHIPTIVLIVDKRDLRKVGQEVEVASYRILDGLQRTLRMKAFCDASALVQRNQDELLDADSNLSRTQLIRRYSKQLSDWDVDANLFLKVLDYAKKHDLASLQAAMAEPQWFELWTGLTEEAQVKKMLVLNAGHKPVKTRHQLELLFLSVLPKLQNVRGSEFTLIREKQASSTTFAKKRAVGEFHFASVIAALIAYFSGKPVTTNVGLVSNLQGEDEDESMRSRVTEFSFKFSKQLVTFLVQLDKVISEDNDTGIQWLGREVTLVGIFAALGAYKQEQQLSHSAVFERFLESAKRIDFRLAAFEEARNNQDLSRVNVGNVNKRAIYNAMLDVLHEEVGKRISWAKYFKES